MGHYQPTSLVVWHRLTLFIDNRLLHGVQRSIGLFQPLDGHDLPTTDVMGQHRACVVGHAVKKYRTTATLGAVATDLGSS